jgi:hypothetical protein
MAANDSEQEGEGSEDGSMEDDPVLHASFLAEMERVLGPLDGLSNDVQFQWIIPVSGIGEMLDLLRGQPSGLGAAGFEAMLRDRFGSTSMLKRVDPEADER